MEKKYLLNLDKLLNGTVNRLRYINRFSGTSIIHPENVSEHSFFTAFFALIIGIHCKRNSMEVDIGKLVQKALLHDIEEQFTGDIIRPVKHYSIQMSNLLEEIVEGSVHLLFDEICRDSTYCFNLWKNAKSGDIEGRIVRYADFLSVLSYLHEESSRGNQLPTDIVNSLAQYAEIFNDSCYDFLSDLRDQVKNHLP